MDSLTTLLDGIIECIVVAPTREAGDDEAELARARECVEYGKNVRSDAPEIGAFGEEQNSLFVFLADWQEG